MSTDTAFALGLLALVGPRFPDRLRAFMLTVVVVDDLVALVVIATVYTATLQSCRFSRRSASSGPCSSRALSDVPRARLSSCSERAAWVACSSPASSRSSSDLRWGFSSTPSRRRARISSARPSGSASSASNRQRSSRVSPRVELRSATSANERLQQHVSPLDELRDRAAVRACERRHRDRRRLPGPSALTSPITLGILFGYVVGKPVGILGCSWLVDPAEPRTAAAAGRLGSGRRGRHDRRDRLHGRPAGRHARLRRTRARGSEARHPQRRRRRRRSHLAAVPRDRAAAPALRASARSWGHGAARRPLRRRRSRAGPRPRAASKRRSRVSSTATSSAHTADGQSRSFGSSSATSATSATSGGTCR